MAGRNPRLTDCVRRLARLQTTKEMKEAKPSQEDKDLDAVILACRKVLGR